VGVQQLSNANALEVDRAAKAALDELAKSFPPGMKYVMPFDTTTVIGDSIREVVGTLGEAIVIVIIVIFLFLLDWRATIIPAITIPVSLIGTFAFIKIFGFSINSLTMFGITLATGLVVDDAIVVIENVQRHINEDHSDPHTATSVAMAEVTSAVIATSLVLISVFVPVSFFPGTTGILYKQFSLTIAFLHRHLRLQRAHPVPGTGGDLPARREAQTRSAGDDRSRDRLHHCFLRQSDPPGVAVRYVVLLLFICGLAGTVYLYQHTPTAFLPTEDQNYLICIVQTPPGASLTYTTDVADKAVKSSARTMTSMAPLPSWDSVSAGAAPPTMD
jgi:HAE1 family hydrophobic/amphiphilic exporter-1